MRLGSVACYKHVAGPLIFSTLFCAHPSRPAQEYFYPIREAARRERRTISGFILNAALNRIANQKRLVESRSVKARCSILVAGLRARPPV